MSPSLVPMTMQTSATARPPIHEGRPKGDHQRRLIVALVAANPGVHILRAAALLGLNWNTCLHHVRRLEGAGLVTVRKVNGRVCLFDRSAGAASTRMGDLMLRDGRNAGLAKILIDSPGINQKSLAGKLGLAASVVHYRLVRLEEAGLVQRANRGREVCVFPTETLQSAYEANQRASALMPAQAESDPSAAPAGLFGWPTVDPDFPVDPTVADPAAFDPEALASAELPVPDTDAGQAA